MDYNLTASKKNSDFQAASWQFVFLLSVFVLCVSAEEHRKMKCLQQFSISRIF